MLANQRALCNRSTHALLVSRRSDVIFVVLRVNSCTTQENLINSNAISPTK